MKKPWMTEEVICDDAGRIVGRAVSRDSLSRGQVQVVREFLTKLYDPSKWGNQTMSKTESKNEKTNLVFLAGIIKKVTIGESRGFALIECGPEKKFIPVSVYEEAELLAKLKKFQDGDFIQLRGFVRPWAEKVNDAWVNHMDVRITEIKNNPPVRAPKKAAAGLDEEMPF